MSDSFKRFLQFGLTGSACITLWACVVGALFGLLSGHFAPSQENSLFEDVMDGMGMMAFLSFGPAFFLFGAAGLLAPGRQGRVGFRALVRSSLSRSVVGILVFSIVGSALATAIGHNTNWLASIIPAKWSLGLMIGLVLGFYLGLTWGFVEACLSIGKTQSDALHSNEAPPIAAP